MRGERKTRETYKSAERRDRNGSPGRKGRKNPEKSGSGRSENERVKKSGIVRKERAGMRILISEEAEKENKKAGRL